MARKKDVIQLPIGNVPKMAKAYGVTNAMIYNALKGNSNSEKAVKIRKDALENYGGVVVKKVVW